MGVTERISGASWSETSFSAMEVGIASGLLPTSFNGINLSCAQYYNYAHILIFFLFYSLVVLYLRGILCVWDLPSLTIRYLEGGGLKFLPDHILFISQERWKALFVHRRIGCSSTTPCGYLFISPIFPQKYLFPKTPAHPLILMSPRNCPM